MLPDAVQAFDNTILDLPQPDIDVCGCPFDVRYSKENRLQFQHMIRMLLRKTDCVTEKIKLYNVFSLLRKHDVHHQCTMIKKHIVFLI